MNDQPTPNDIKDWLQRLGYISHPLTVTLPSRVIAKNGDTKRLGTITLPGATYIRGGESYDEFSIYVAGQLDHNAIHKMNCFVSNVPGAIKGEFEMYMVSGYSDKRTEGHFTTLTKDNVLIHPFGHSFYFRRTFKSFFELKRAYEELKGEYQMTIEFVEEE